MLDNSLENIFPGKPEYVGKIDITYKRKVDADLVGIVTNFVQTSLGALDSLGLGRIVIGLSGGVDSTVICALAKQAVGTKAFAVIVDFDKGKDSSEDTEFSTKIAEKIRIDYKIVKAYELFQAHLNILDSNSLLARLHLRSRVINNIIFQVADNQMAAVIDSTDKSEKLLGRHAESFMGHIAPLIDFYKSELYDMLDYFSLSEVREKEAGCPELSDKDAFGVNWEILDKILYLLTQKTMSLEKITKEYGVDIGWLQKLNKRIEKQYFRTEIKKLFLK